VTIKPIPILFLIVFIDLVGFGIMIPLLPFYVERVGAGPEIITLTMGLYSLFQFIFAPIWGGLSDRFGRCPVLSISLLGLSVSYLILAFADNLLLVMFSRIVGGVMAGNISAAFAYVADITSEKDRAKGMGLLGAAFGLGFIFGPVIGGLLAGSDLESANFVAPSLTASMLSFIAFLGVILVLPESLSEEIKKHNSTKKSQKFRDKIKTVLLKRAIFLLVSIGFTATMAWSMLETTLALWGNRLLDLGPRELGLLLTYVGIIGVILQGFLIGPITAKIGEIKVLFIAFIFLFIGFFVISFAGGWTLLILALTILSIGNGLANPSLSSLVSQESGEDDRGSVLGFYQGASSLARVIGPMYSGFAFANLGPSFPFMIATGWMAISLLILIFLASPNFFNRIFSSNNN